MSSLTATPTSISPEAARPPRGASKRSMAALSGYGLLLLASLTLTGCTAILSPISGIPAHRVPPQFLGAPRANWEQIDLARLRREPPRHYLLDEGDILGVYVEGVLGTAEEPPPVHFPEEQSDLPPSLGFPVPVREDGTISLPLIPPVNVRGLTMPQVENVIRRAYTVDHQILVPGRDRIIITLMRERTVRVIVIREDVGETRRATARRRGDLIEGPERVGRGFIVNLPAYKNDVMHALAETGGLPGVTARNEVKILKGRLADAERREAFIQDFYAKYAMDPCMCPPPLPDDPSTIRIPLRLPPGMMPTFRPEDILLEEGDIVYIEARDAEVFYTGGLLPGGEFPLPRDHDLDVLGAMAVAGQGVGATAGGARMPGVGGFGAVIPPTQLFILRKTPCDGQVVIMVDISRAIQDPRSRPLVMPGDTLILRYKPMEEVANFAIAAFFTYGIRELLRR